jgi:hypothetical protein
MEVKRIPGVLISSMITSRESPAAQYKFGVLEMSWTADLVQCDQSRYHAKTFDYYYEAVRNLDPNTILICKKTIWQGSHVSNVSHDSGHQD